VNKSSRFDIILDRDRQTDRRTIRYDTIR